MSEEYSNAGTVRRRPRASHQRTESTFEENGTGKSQSTHDRNGQGHAGFREQAYREETYYDRAPKNERRKRARQREVDEEEEKPKHKRDLPWREIDAEGPLFRCPFDPWRLYGALKRNLYWILGGAFLL